MSTPPWLNVSPRDFLQAAEAGAQMGLRIAQMRNRDNFLQRLPRGGGGSMPRIIGGGRPYLPQADEGGQNPEYSVAGDESKLLGQTMTETEARNTFNQSEQGKEAALSGIPGLGFSAGHVESPAEQQFKTRSDWEMKQKIAIAKAVQDEKTDAAGPFVKIVPPGSTALRVNRETGESEPLYTTPNKPVAPRRQSAVDKLLSDSSSGTKASTVPPGAIAYLKANPDTRDQFDEMYGQGAAASALGE